MNKEEISVQISLNAFFDVDAQQAKSEKILLKHEPSQTLEIIYLYLFIFLKPRKIQKTDFVRKGSKLFLGTRILYEQFH